MQRKIEEDFKFASFVEFEIFRQAYRFIFWIVWYDIIIRVFNFSNFHLDNKFVELEIRPSCNLFHPLKDSKHFE